MRFYNAEHRYLYTGYITAVDYLHLNNYKPVGGSESKTTAGNSVYQESKEIKDRQIIRDLWLGGRMGIGVKYEDAIITYSTNNTFTYGNLWTSDQGRQVEYKYYNEELSSITVKSQPDRWGRQTDLSDWLDEDDGVEQLKTLTSSWTSIEKNPNSNPANGLQVRCVRERE